MKKYYFWITFVIVGCSKYPADVEWALKLAGDNRAELEKVLVHYSQQPEDTLKLQAAYFLIANMPYNFTACDPQMEAFKDYIMENELNTKAWDNFQKSLGKTTGEVEIEPDIQFMTSKYLIRNIDFSFKVWQETPWGQYVSFENFCEDILPYRLDHEPLEYWKENYYAIFRPILDTMQHENRLDEICLKMIEVIKNQGWIWGVDLHANGFGATTILQKRYGSCKEQAELVAYSLRSVGIPSGIDKMIQIPNNIIRYHYWNYTHTIDGNLFGFDFDGNYLTNGRWEIRKYGKAYRQRFALQKESLPVRQKNIYIPEGGLREKLLEDVSFEYCPDTHIAVRIEEANRSGRNDLAYLCVFNNRDWIPMDWCKPKMGMAEYRYVEPDILYQVRWNDATRNVAASPPFIFHSNENIQLLNADTSRLQRMTLLRKYRLPPVFPWYHQRSVGGMFQGANTTDFRDSVTLHKISEPSGFNWMYVKVEHPGKFRYVRYLSAQTGAFNNMAEVEFYSDGMKLSGEVIGTDSTAMTFPNDTKHAVFDGDPLTFFDSLYPNMAWAGLRLDKAYQIDAIRYIFRNDDNNVRKGDRYELLYNSKGEWLSAGVQIADSSLLFYESVPSNTLYWLRNHTRGKEERPFIYENGRQVFY